MKPKLFSKKQKIVISTWLIVALASGIWVSNNNYMVFPDGFEQLSLQLNLILLGFVLTALSMIGSILGKDLVKQLQGNGAYYSLMNNFYILSIVLLFNALFSLLVLLMPVSKLWVSNFIYFVNLLIILDLTAVFLLLWYGVSRLARLMKHIK